MASTRDDDEVECPVCCNELDLTDRSIRYCECGCKFIQLNIYIEGKGVCGIMGVKWLDCSVAAMCAHAFVDVDVRVVLQFVLVCGAIIKY